MKIDIKNIEEYKINTTLFYVFNLLFIAAIISPFILPSIIMDPFANGPKLWFIFLISILFFVSFCYFLVLPKLSLNLKINQIDTIIFILLITISLKKYFINTPFINDKFLTYVGLIIIYAAFKLFISSIGINKKRIFLQIATTTILIVLFLSCCVGLMQLYSFTQSNNPFFKVTGMFSNPARYANYLIILLPFCVTTYWFLPTEFKFSNFLRCFSAIVLLFAILILPATFTRSAWLGVFTSFCLLFFYKYQAKVINLLKQKMVLIAILLFGIFGSILLYKIKPVSAMGRLLVWEVSYDIIKENPITGIGYGNFENKYALYQAKYFSSNTKDLVKINQADVIRYPYNIFLQILCEQGIIGFIVFLILLYSIFHKFLFSTKWIKNTIVIFTTRTLLACIVSVLVSGFSSYPFDILPVLITLYIFLGTLSGIYPNCIFCKVIPFNNSILKFTGIIFLSASIFAFYTVYVKFKAYKDWKSYDFKDKNIIKLIEIEKILNSDIDFIDFYSSKLLYEKRYTEVIKTLDSYNYMMIYPSFYLNKAEAYVATKQYDKAEVNFKIAVNMIPNRFTSKYLLAKFYFQTKKFQKAINLSNEILSMRVKIPSPAINEIVKKTKTILKKSLAEAAKASQTTNL